MVRRKCLRFFFQLCDFVTATVSTAHRITLISLSICVCIMSTSLVNGFYCQCHCHCHYHSVNAKWQKLIVFVNIRCIYVVYVYCLRIYDLVVGRFYFNHRTLTISNITNSRSTLYASRSLLFACIGCVLLLVGLQSNVTNSQTHPHACAFVLPSIYPYVCINFVTVSTVCRCRFVVSQFQLQPYDLYAI